MLQCEQNKSYFEKKNKQPVYIVAFISLEDKKEENNKRNLGGLSLLYRSKHLINHNQ